MYTQQLLRIVQKALEDGIYFCGIYSDGEGYKVIAVNNGVMAELEKKVGKEMNVNELSVDDMLNLSPCIGEGKTRETAYKNAIKAYKARNKKASKKKRAK